MDLLLGDSRRRRCDNKKVHRMLAGAVAHSKQPSISQACGCKHKPVRVQRVRLQNGIDSGVCDVTSCLMLRVDPRAPAEL